jgi:hypothetical protein
MCHAQSGYIIVGVVVCACTREAAEAKAEAEERAKAKVSLCRAQFAVEGWRMHAEERGDVDGMFAVALMWIWAGCFQRVDAKATAEAAHRSG